MSNRINRRDPENKAVAQHRRQSRSYDSKIWNEDQVKSMFNVAPRIHIVPMIAVRFSQVRTITIMDHTPNSRELSAVNGVIR